MKRVFSYVAASAVLVWSTFAAAAPPRSRAAADRLLASDAEIVATVNTKTLRTTELFKKFVPELLKKERQVDSALTKIKSQCAMNPIESIDDITVGVDPQEKGVVFVAVSGVDEKKFVDCVKKLAKSEAGKTITATKRDLVTELKSDGEADALYFAWLPENVLVLATDPLKRELLEKKIGGKGAFAGTALGRRLQAAPEDAAIALAWTKVIKQQGLSVREGSLVLGYKAKAISAAVSVLLPSADEATQAAALVSMLPGMMGAVKDAPPELGKLVKTVAAKATGSELTVSASAPEGDLMKIAKWAEKNGMR
jgi:hypothetical protein